MGEGDPGTLERGTCDSERGASIPCWTVPSSQNQPHRRLAPSDRAFGGGVGTGGSPSGSLPLRPARCGRVGR